MDAQTWAVGLIKELKEKKQTKAAKKLETAIGKDGASGLAKIIADYSSKNPLDGLDLKISGNLIEGESVRPVTFDLGGDNQIGTAILFVLMMVLWLAE